MQGLTIPINTAKGRLSLVQTGDTLALFGAMRGSAQGGSSQSGAAFAGPSLLRKPVAPQRFFRPPSGDAALAKRALALPPSPPERPMYDAGAPVAEYYQGLWMSIGSQSACVRPGDAVTLLVALLEIATYPAMPL